MQKHALYYGHMDGILRRNISGIAAFFVLFCFGACFGWSLCRSLYGGVIESIASFGAKVLRESIPLNTILLFALLPAFLYLCCMMFCACERRALPVWGAAQLLAGVRCGMAVCMMVGVSLLSALPLQLLWACGQMALAIMSLDCRLDIRLDAGRIIDRFLIPATVYLIAASVMQLWLTVWLRRTLWR